MEVWGLVLTHTELSNKILPLSFLHVLKYYSKIPDVLCVCVCIRALCSYLELFEELGVCLLHLGSISCLPPFCVVFFWA